MRELIELQTGQVSFISGLLAGFAMTAALHILRHGMRDKVAQFVFYASVLSSLLFLVGLYVDVRLMLELAGQSELSSAVLERVKLIRFIGTTSATIALCLFVLSLGMLGWLNSRSSGVVTSVMTLLVAGVLVFVWVQISLVNSALN